MSQRSLRVEHYRRAAPGVWEHRLLGPGGELALSGGARVSVDAIYRGAFDYPSDAE